MALSGPDKVVKITPIIKAFLRPNLSERVPKEMAPIVFPNDRAIWTIARWCEFSQTRPH